MYVSRKNSCIQAAIRDAAGNWDVNTYPALTFGDKPSEEYNKKSIKHHIITKSKTKLWSKSNVY